MDNLQQPDPNQQPQSFLPQVQPAINKLDDLPIEAKVELDSYLKRNLTIGKTKTLMESKWVGKTDALPASYPTFKAYFELHKPRLLAERLKEVNDAKNSSDAFRSLASLTSEITEGKAVDFKDKYQEILDLIEDRVAMIQEQQTHGFASAQYEAVMVQWSKAKKEVLEKMEQYKTDVDEKVHEADMAFLESYSYELLLEVCNTVKEMYGEERFTEFKEKLKLKIIRVTERSQEAFDRNFNDI